MMTIVHFAVTIAQTHIKKTLYHFLWLSHTENTVCFVVLISRFILFLCGGKAFIETQVKTGI